ncbi:MAG: glucose-1-phosphate thymidylyltransferase RfbA [Aquificaceae bacterium]
MKAVILAGGSGTRLYPTTLVVNKHLLPVYNKPMIYYPLSVAMLLGISEVGIVVNPHDLQAFKSLLSDGSWLGMKIRFFEQDKPRGLADGLIVCEDFIKDSYVVYILGDNILFGHDLVKVLKDGMQAVFNGGGACVFGYYVNDPSRFGVVEFDKDGRVLSVEEKPVHHRSNYAIVGVYFLDKEASKIAKSIKPSERGELEITSVLEEYLKQNKLFARIIGRGFAWFDAGTHDSFLEAGEFVATIERRTGLMIGCVEEIAFRNGWIDKDQLISLAKPLSKTSYGQYLMRVAGEGS